MSEYDTRTNRGINKMENPDRIHVLMCVAACHPDIGSEYGIGWQWVCQAAKHHRVTVITSDARNTDLAIRKHLEHDKALAESAEFVFVPWFAGPTSKLGHWLWRMFPIIYYRNYQLWMRRAAGVARGIIGRERVDLIHQVTYATFREPGYMWNLDRPFVWGPVGGNQDVPWAFLPSLGWVEGSKHAARNALNWIHWRFRRRVGKCMRRAAAISAVASDTQLLIERSYGLKSVVIPATACTRRFGDEPEKERGPVRFVFSGLHIARKGLPFALHALAGMRELNWNLDVLGEGPLTAEWQALTQRLGLADRVRFCGRLSRDEAIRVMSDADVLVHPSLQEGWPTVVIEALSLGMPVVTTNHHGMADMITSECGILVRVDSPGHLIEDLGTALRSLAANPDLVGKLALGARRRAEEFSLARQEEAICGLYAEALKP